MKRKLSLWLESQWYKLSFWHVLLIPVSFLFYILSSVRRFFYRTGIFSSFKINVPVIVVGNISVGGTGKSPLVISIAEHLIEAGFKPAIISRGYGRKSKQISSVRADSDPALFGDEPVMIAGRTGCPVFVGSDRVAVARALLLEYTRCNMIICDDGLQHYRLQRDFEIVIVDGVRGFGNKLLLPAGPLRELPSRLNEVDAIVVNGDARLEGAYAMTISSDSFVNLKDSSQAVDCKYFAGKEVYAFAGLGNPDKFFAYLKALGVSFVSHSFPDHYQYQPEDLHINPDAVIIMTEKDAVKCRKFAGKNCWYLPIKASLDVNFFSRLKDKIRG